MYAYVGSRTTRERNARGEGITVYLVDQEKGTLAPVQVVKDLVNPSFLALNKAGDRLYTVHGDKTDVSAFSVDKASGKLTFINTQSCEGKNPVHLALDPTERFLVVSNHVGGSLAVMNVAEDGSLGTLNQLLKLEGPLGPHRVEQPFAKPHFNPFDHTGARAYDHITFLTPTDNHEEAAHKILNEPEVAHIHARSQEAGCFHFLITKHP